MPAFINDTWRVSNRLSLNLGLRFDKYSGYLPEQEHPAGRFNPVGVSFPAQDDVFNWNLLSPRAGITYDMFGNGQTVLKLNYGQDRWNPGADFLFNVSPNVNGGWNKRYSWIDRIPGTTLPTNGNGIWDPGEQGCTATGWTGLPVATSGGAATESLDPNLDNTYTRRAGGLVRTRAIRQLRRADRGRLARSAAAVPASQHVPGIRELHGTDLDSRPRPR